MTTPCRLLAGLRDVDVAIRHLGVCTRVIERSGDNRESNGSCCCTTGLGCLEVIPLIRGEHSDQQPDEHDRADDSATPHGDLHVPKVRHDGDATVYPSDNCGKPVATTAASAQWRHGAPVRGAGTLQT